MDDLKHVDFVARGVMLDSHIEDAIKEISMEYKVSADNIFNDYKFYKPAILLCNSLYHFMTVKFISDMGSKKIYSEFLSQADYGINNFIDYVIVLFGRGTLMDNLNKSEKSYIQGLITERLQKLNRSIQWA